MSKKYNQNFKIESLVRNKYKNKPFVRVKTHRQGRLAVPRSVFRAHDLEMETNKNNTREKEEPGHEDDFSERKQHVMKGSKKKGFP